jgi:wyosine [tRNA(Phe)-imidazoG37] synthetase (radical SAM superfamily)
MDNLIFGPVPSRRLGRSLGINNIPHKVCSYSCAYCQVGKADIMQVERREFYLPNAIVREVKRKLSSLSTADYPNYLTIVPDGEPTLDIHLGELIMKLKSLDIPVAVITNSSILHRKDVQDDLMHADYISVKVDTVNPVSWKKINKPHKSLDLGSILAAISDFSKSFEGILVTESMLIKGINDTEEELIQLARYLKKVKSDMAYLAIPTRPPAFSTIYPASEASVTLAYNIFSYMCISAELLTGYEGNAFASSGNFADDILSITAVHPMRKDAVMQLMAKSNASTESLDQLIRNGLIEKISYNKQEYFLRKFGHNSKH